MVPNMVPYNTEALTPQAIYNVVHKAERCLDRLPLPPSSSPRTNGMWMSSTNSVDHYALGRGGKTSTRPPTGIMSNGNNGISVGGLHPDGVGAVGSETSAGGSRDWSSLFEEKELFSFPRQFVSSPSL
ncbi:hypothetical protein Tco_1033667 [Tanacetum coccineum]